MLEKIRGFIFTKKAVIISGLIFLLFLLVVLPVMANLTANKTGVVESPDTAIDLSVDDYYQMIEAYEEEGRDFYILLRWTFDLIWPFVYLFFLVSWIGFFGRNLSITRKAFIYLPWFGVAFDFLENIFATVAMSIYPQRIDSLIYLLKISSLFKWLFIAISFLVLLFLIGYKSLRKK